MNGGIALSSSAGRRARRCRWGRHLVPGERGIVDVQGVEVHRLVRHRLAGVQHRERTDALARDTSSATGATAPVIARMMAESNDFDPLVEPERIQVDTPGDR